VTDSGGGCLGMSMAEGIDNGSVAASEFERGNLFTSLNGTHHDWLGDTV
jgi:hypothetical protein